MRLVCEVPPEGKGGAGVVFVLLLCFFFVDSSVC